jgi:hypothetical protein
VTIKTNMECLSIGTREDIAVLCAWSAHGWLPASANTTTTLAKVF